MKIKKKHLGEIHRATASNGTIHKVLIEDTPACIRLAKKLKLDIFEKKDATNKGSDKPKRSSNTDGQDNDK